MDINFGEVEVMNVMNNEENKILIGFRYVYSVNDSEYIDEWARTERYESPVFADRAMAEDAFWCHLSALHKDLIKSLTPEEYDSFEKYWEGEVTYEEVYLYKKPCAEVTRYKLGY